MKSRKEPKILIMTKGSVEDRAACILMSLEHGYRMVTLKGVTTLTSPDHKFMCYVPPDVLEYLVEHDLLEYLVEHDLADQRPLN